MLAARLHEDGRELVVDEIPPPVPAAGDVLVRVRTCGLCATDLHAIDGHIPTAFRPITLGHEFAGVVEDTGARVFVNPLVACGRCEACVVGRPQICVERRIIGLHRDGALAELVAVPEQNLVPLPDEVSFEEAAIVEPASTAFHAISSRASVRAGSRVAVFGVGGIGFHAVQIARLSGAAAVVAVDVAEAALERALQFGATAAVDGRGDDPPREVRRLTDGGVDVALECVGVPQTCEWAVRSLRRAGVAALVGVGPQPLTLPPTSILAALEVEVRGVFGYSADDVARVVRLIAAGALDAAAAVSAVLPLGDAPDAVERFRRKDENPVRVLLAP